MVIVSKNDQYLVTGGIDLVEDSIKWVDGYLDQLNIIKNNLLGKFESARLTNKWLVL
jgi:hypothetical protein